QQELERADDERHAPDIGMVVGAQNHQRQCAQSGEEHQNGQQVVAGRDHLVTMPIMGLSVGQKTMRMITSAPTTTHVAWLRALPDCVCRTESPTAVAPCAMPLTVPSMAWTSTIFQRTWSESQTSGRTTRAA